MDFAKPQALMSAGLRLVIGLILVMTSVECAADEDLARYYAGLRLRGLYRVAEADCLRRLTDERISPSEQAELTIELSRSYAEHAAYRSGRERDQLWARSVEVIDQHLTSNSTGPDRVLLETQRAFAVASQGAQLRWQVGLFPLDERAAERAATVLRRALVLLRPLPTALEEQSRAIADVSTPTAAAETPSQSPHHLRKMRRSTEFRTAIASLDLAKVLPTSADRAGALHEAETRLRELVKTPKPDERAWQAEVLLIQVLRLRGDFDRVEPRVTTLLAKDAPPAIRDATIAEWVRTDLDSQHPDAAIKRLQAHRREHGLESEELKGLVVETLLAARRVAFEKEQPELAHDLLAQAETYTADVEGAWGTRCRVLLEAAREADVYGPELAASVRQAKWAWKNGNLDEAVTAYRRATAEAHRSGQAEFAAEFGLTLATLQTETGDFHGAVDTLTGLLNSYPEGEKTAEADLLRAYARGKQFEQQPDDALQQAYRAALDEHRAQFADSATAAEAAWMSARLDEYERNWSAAIRMLKSIPPESKRGPAAAVRIAVVYEQKLTELRQQGEPTAVVERQAIEDLTALVERFPSSSGELSSKHAEMALRLAKLLLRQEPPAFARADSLLERILRSDRIDGTGASSPLDAEMTASASTLASALQLRIISLAGQGRLDDARSLLSQLADRHPQRMLDVLNGLTAAAEQIAIQHRQAVSGLQLEVSQRLEQQRAKLSVDAQLQLDESLAQSYAAIGQFSKAAALYEKLIWQQPKQGRLVISLAMLYETCGTASCLRNALEQWERLEHRQRKGSVEWLESRYHLAWCSHQLGDDHAARKLIGVTRVLYPDLGSPQLKGKFAELSAELDGTM